MTPQEERKRKLWLFLPLLVLPFLALGFYALGGGKGTTADHSAATAKGINTDLPGAKLQADKSTDKLSLMDRAKRDSASERSHSAAGAFAALGWDTSRFSSTATTAKTASNNEAQIKDRLVQINKQINQPVPINKIPANDYNANTKSADLERLERLLKQKQQANEPDAQMQQLSGMLDKIMQIQNPSLAKSKDKKPENVKPDSAFKAIPAIIDGNQKVPPGGVVKLRLKDSITINGIHYLKGQELSGQCAVTNQRLLLDIKNIRLGTTIVPVNLSVFSLDGLQGINAPEAELAGAAGDGANGALENMQFLSADYSLTTQAATAGISAAKSLLGKKVKKIKVKLKGGETVLLRNNQDKH
ncbi:conjugative transposon protein TraM [Mucilaginibacter sp. cycad4]|uniref:conjugative transposon protein TraM n=1 Tax=Mucilaginibacter sp. cycad4 TaxID=3342096 RepID=UPI002AAB6D1C|nr:conjugative transposon protein TraM [Mucilaginibacter gossypii]WPV02155.1 conjugative transposon protein TraM [Mucilaginibacter gossypii]